MAFDNELGSVVESIYGNRKENYMIIRAIADYKVCFFHHIYQRDYLTRV